MSHPRAPDRSWGRVPRGPARMACERPSRGHREAGGAWLHRQAAGGLGERPPHPASLSPFASCSYAWPLLSPLLAHATRPVRTYQRPPRTEEMDVATITARGPEVAAYGASMNRLPRAFARVLTSPPARRPGAVKPWNARRRQGALSPLKPGHLRLPRAPHPETQSGWGGGARARPCFWGPRGDICGAFTVCPLF